MDHSIGRVGGETVAIDVVHLPARSRFEAHTGGRHGATLEYRISGPAAVLTHTQLVRGEDVACRTSVIDAALDVLVRSGYYAVALCPHVRRFLATHPDRHVRVDTRFLDPVTLPEAQAC
jgi:hypothetical protein